MYKQIQEEAHWMKFVWCNIWSFMSLKSWK